jgi:hypothetical protein
MSELRTRPRVNEEVEVSLEEGDAYLQATSGFGIVENDRNYNPVAPPPEIGMLVDDALELDDPRTFLPFGGVTL